MDLSLSEELHQFSQELQCFLSPVVLQDIARQVGFVQRSSKYRLTNSLPLRMGLVRKSLAHHLHNCAVD